MPLARPSCSFREWLRTIVHNRCISHLRRRSREVSYDEVSSGGGHQITETATAPSPEDDLLRAEEEGRLHAALARLTDDQRSVAALHYLEDTARPGWC